MARSLRLLMLFSLSSTLPSSLQLFLLNSYTNSHFHLVIVKFSVLLVFMVKLRFESISGKTF